jgi:hypothetical protein
MHRLRIRDHLVLHLDDLVLQDLRDLRDEVLHLLLDRNCDMDLMLVHLLRRDVV